MINLKFLDINLIDGKNKHDWELHMLSKVFVIFGSIAILVILLLSSLLFSYKKYLQKSSALDKNVNGDVYIQRLEEEKEISEQMDRLNYKINFYYDILKNHREVFKVLGDICNKIPNSMVVSSIDFYYQENIPLLTVKGISGNRADFIEFESYIKNNENFFDIQSPFSNIAKKENAEFSISMKIKDAIMKIYE